MFPHSKIIMNKLCRIEIWFWKLIELEDIKVLRKLFLYSFYGYVYGFDWDYSGFFCVTMSKGLCANWTLKCTRTNSVVTIFLLFSNHHTSWNIFHYVHAIYFTTIGMHSTVPWWLSVKQVMWLLKAMYESLMIVGFGRIW